VPAFPGTPTGLDVRGTITAILIWLCNFLALVAVAVIVIAGIRLIVSQGNEDQKETAKKTIFYAIAGLLVVLFARVIVGLVTQELPRFVVGT
jgi:cell division protein FtsW (lipid II flippase)